MQYLSWILVICCFTDGFIIKCEAGHSGVKEVLTAEPTLVFAQIIYRHGERCISRTYPNDPHKDMKNWPEGFGELTNVGRQQQYELGIYFRKRYLNFLGDNGAYRRDKVYVRSTNCDRTLMSAGHNMAGMFPPQNGQVWNKKLGLQWHAVPIHTIPDDDDEVLAMYKPCPLYEKKAKEFEASREVKDILFGNATFIHQLQHHTNLTFNRLLDVKMLYQTLQIEESKGLKLPPWTKDFFYSGSRMEKISNLCFEMYSKSKELARLRVGFLIKEMYDRFVEKKNGTLKPDRLMWIYSAHETQVVFVLSALGLWNIEQQPEYAATLFFELHKANGNYHIEIYYKYKLGDNRKKLEPLVIPKCGKQCPLEKFYQLYKDIMPTANFDTECALS